MKLQFKLTAASVLFLSGIAGATLNGPVGTPCGGTTTAGTTMTGTQGWSTNPATGQGYWSCCQAGTSCAGRDKPASGRVVRDISAVDEEGGSEPTIRDLSDFLVPTAQY